jgi:uncharacterized protein with HEPN domain
MSRSAADRLKDIIHSAELAGRHARGLDARALAAADQQRDAALFQIAVIGEAASHLPAEIQALAPEIPWVRVKDMRHHIVHGYWQIDLEVVALTVEHRLDPLRAAAKRLIDLIERAET